MSLAMPIFYCVVYSPQNYNSLLCPVSHWYNVCTWFTAAGMRLIFNLFRCCFTCIINYTGVLCNLQQRSALVSLTNDSWRRSCTGVNIITALNRIGDSNLAFHIASPCLIDIVHLALMCFFCSLMTQFFGSIFLGGGKLVI